MKILVVSGFLGAGKTTFISKLIESSGLNPVILENEYGDDSLDSKALRKDDDIKILEFMEGCVCCSKKDTFVNSLLTINASLTPEYLIVEPSGIGKLSNIIENINKITYGDIELLNPVVILSIDQIDMYIKQYPDIYLDQVKNAGTIIFSKIENQSKDLVERAKNKIHYINNNVKIIDTPYQDKDKDFFLELMDHKNEAELVKGSDGFTNIKQETFKDPNLKSISQLINLLEDVIHNRFGNIVRAKGELMINDERIRFDVADYRYAIAAAEKDNSECSCVFIGNDINANLLSTHLNIRNKKIDMMSIGLKKPSLNHKQAIL